MKYTTDILSEIQTWCHYTDTIEEIDYGALYNWYAATDARNIANTGWHVPTNDEFTTLIQYLSPGGTPASNTAGGQCKETGLTHWASPNTGATNSALMNLRGAGKRTSTGSFIILTSFGGLWTTTPFGPSGPNSALYAWVSSSLERFLWTYGGTGSNELKVAGYSVRPIKDSTTLSHGQTGTYTGNDGKVYRTICIGTQEWLADNLAETKYRDGTPIPEVTDNDEWAALTTGARCSYNNDEDNALTMEVTSSTTADSTVVTVDDDTILVDTI
jgi:uncharacterized protein (TIGR02145 family)